MIRPPLLTRLLLPGAAFLLTGAASASATPFTIDLWTVDYSTYLFRQTVVETADDYTATTASRATHSYWNDSSGLGLTPLSDSWLDASATMTASADLFAVSASADDDYVHPDNLALASAETTVVFSPQTDAMADIGLSFWANAEWFWAPSSASLIDLTTSQTIWNYGWLEDGVGMNFDWTDWNYDENGSLVSVSALLTLNTLLLATHHYELAFTTFVNANAGDNPSGSVTVSGLRTVPDQSATAVLFLLGVMTVLAFAAEKSQGSGMKHPS